MMKEFWFRYVFLVGKRTVHSKCTYLSCYHGLGMVTQAVGGVDVGDGHPAVFADNTAPEQAPFDEHVSHMSPIHTRLVNSK